MARSRPDVSASLAIGVLAAALAANPTVPATAADEAGACLDFIQGAEKTQGIPEGLLMAIAYTESGRVTSDGRRVPWPWTVNADGQSHFLGSKKEAIAFVEDLQDAGASVIDVGCMQINLYYHPDAFASLEAAFDPATNVAYAAQFLKLLEGESGDWGIATQYYHSRTSYLGRSYAGRVIANGFDGIISDVEPIKPLSAKDRAILTEEVPDHLTAAYELIAKSSPVLKLKTAAMGAEQPKAIGVSGFESPSGSAMEVRGSVD
jgi:hypothetical protein